MCVCWCGRTLVLVCACMRVWVGGSECVGVFVILLWTGGCKMLEC